ncbi:hypothetical protein L218DRAFT_949886 [Marasmius fiardii PR-910]|nr:hypothetical protein L218DRAFT_949886 [Marasmius fiardii PR-910]
MFGALFFTTLTLLSFRLVITTPIADLPLERRLGSNEINPVDTVAGILGGLPVAGGLTGMVTNVGDHGVPPRISNLIPLILSLKWLKLLWWKSRKVADEPPSHTNNALVQIGAESTPTNLFHGWSRRGKIFWAQPREREK